MTRIIIPRGGRSEPHICISINGVQYPAIVGVPFEPPPEVLELLHNVGMRYIPGALAMWEDGGTWDDEWVWGD